MPMLLNFQPAIIPDAIALSGKTVETIYEGNCLSKPYGCFIRVGVRLEKSLLLPGGFCKLDISIENGSDKIDFTSAEIVVQELAEFRAGSYCRDSKTPLNTVRIDQVNAPKKSSKRFESGFPISASSHISFDSKLISVQHEIKLKFHVSGWWRSKHKIHVPIQIVNFEILS